MTTLPKTLPMAANCRVGLHRFGRRAAATGRNPRTARAPHPNVMIWGRCRPACQGADLVILAGSTTASARSAAAGTLAESPDCA